jgi:hypothetical protein
MAIIGTHMLLYSSQADALRVMLRDAFGFESVDAGDGWLIFALRHQSSGCTLRRVRPMNLVFAIK